MRELAQLRGDCITVAIRPEQLTIRRANENLDDVNRIEGSIETISYGGNLVRTTSWAKDGDMPCEPLHETSSSMNFPTPSENSVGCSIGSM